MKRSVLALSVCSLILQVSAQFTTPASNLENHVFTLASDSLLGRGFGTPQGSRAATYIASQMEKAGIEALNGSYFHPFNHRQGILNITGTNVAGIIPGNDPLLKHEYIVLGAHFDHLGWKVIQEDTVIYNGADDNASGTAAIIEIGRNLSSRQATLGRSVVLVAFDGEESGLVGSTWFVENSLVPPHQIKLMFSLDMVGMYEKNGGLDMMGVKLLTGYDKIVGELAGAYGITVTKANKIIGQRTDTAPFGNMGIPAIHAFTGLESPYHKPEDTPEKLDFEGMARVTNYLSAVTHQLSSEPVISDLPPLEEGQVTAKTEVFRPGIRLNTGSSYFNYTDLAYKGKSIFAYEAGLFGNIQATSFLMIQPEVLYSSQGSQTGPGNIRSHSLTTPVNLLFATPDEGYFRMYLMAGGYYSYHFGGKFGENPMDFDNEFTTHEYGISYGIGMEAMNVQVGLYYRRGLSDLFQESADTKTIHQSIYFTLGFLF